MAKITFIGGGNMAQAIVGGLREKGYKGADFAAVEPLAETRARLSREFGMQASNSMVDVLPLGGLVILSVKPQQMREAAAALKPHLGKELVLSIAAGIRLGDLSRWLGGYRLLARCMPNTPALVGEGMSGLYCRPEVPAPQAALAQQVLEAVGQVIRVDDETVLDPVTAVSGSGPAYVFLFIEAIEQAARELGLTAKQARLLSVQTFVGAAKLAAGSTEDVSVLRERVTSKGGTTERALASMRDDKVVEAIVRAVRAANERAKKLGDELGKDS